ncbi:MAG: alpha/beta fold hydrolase [candidate division KSB1 bacterium]|nr:alpha/beta fold hydrolase [candidate division KSB1 bacterium]MDZ7366240.1 alpha/beta fold hydrolase [candidate division KSB1 bacterium]MDZ7404458.1 alpha/beta fold hydrolase [candidate division KSB1 bacterium]
MFTTTTINNVRLSFIDKGEGPAILFAHGFPFSRAIWQPQITAFAKTHRVIAPDLRGHGQSSAPAGIYAMETFADDLHHLIEERKCGPVVLVGHSMGGYISFAFYRNFPQKVRALILFCTRASADSEEGKAARENLAQRAEREGPAAVAEQMLPKMLAPATAASRPELVAQVRDFMLATSVNGLTGSLRGMAARPSAVELLPKIAVPTLVVAGENDLIIPASEAATMAKTIPNAELAMISHAGHLASLENPDEVIVRMQQFLDKI